MSSIYLDTHGYKLRSLVPDDASPVFLQWINNDRLMKGLNLAGIHFTQESLRQFIHSFDNRSNYLIGIFPNSGQDVIGFYTVDVNHQHKTGNLTAAVGGVGYEGKGVLWDTAEALTEYFFLYCDVDKMTARVLAKNYKILFNFLGNPLFSFEARLHQECLGIDGQRLDLLLFSAFKSNMRNAD